MTKYFLQHKGNFVNKVVAITSSKPVAFLQPDNPACKTKEISEQQYKFLMACDGSLDKVLDISKSIVELVSK